MAGTSRSAGGAKPVAGSGRSKRQVQKKARPHGRIRRKTSPGAASRGSKAAAQKSSPAAKRLSGSAANKAAARGTRSGTVKQKRTAAAKRSHAGAPGPSAARSRAVEIEALARETRRLRRALRQAIRERDAEAAARARELVRTKTDLERENEILEAQLTKLVQEIGQLRTIVDRVDRLEAEVRIKDARHAEREAGWARERAALEAEIARQRAPRTAGGGSAAAPASEPLARAASAPAAARTSGTAKPAEIAPGARSPRPQGTAGPGAPRAELAPSDRASATSSQNARDERGAARARRGNTATVVQLSSLRRPLQG